MIGGIRCVKFSICETHVQVNTMNISIHYVIRKFSARRLTCDANPARRFGFWRCHVQLHSELEFGIVIVLESEHNVSTDNRIFPRDTMKRRT